MAYNEEKLTKLKHLKQLAQRIHADFAAKTELSALSGRVDGLRSLAGGLTNAMYQAPTCTTYCTEIDPAANVTGPVTDATVGSLLGDDKLAELTSSKTDDAGNNLYDFVINDVTIGAYSKHTKLSDILDAINGSEEAGVSVSYSEAENKFTFTAKTLGSGVEFKFDNGLSSALFDLPETPGLSGKGFAEAYGASWIRDGETVKFIVSIDGGGDHDLYVTKETTIGEVVDRMNQSGQGMNYAFSYNKYTGQIEVRDKKNGGLRELTITDMFGDEAAFDTSNAPASPYTYGKDAVFTAIKVNGKMEPVINREVNIVVPVKVSDLKNDAKYQTDTDVAAAVAAAEHLKRKIVANTDAIDVSAADAAQYIYMVQKSTTKSGNKYDEYMVIDGVLERVGDWAVNLSGYVEQEEGKGLSSNDYTDEDKAKLAGISEGATKVTASETAGAVKVDGVDIPVVELATDAEVTEMLTEVFNTAE